jgi:hypothetical protein
MVRKWLQATIVIQNYNGFAIENRVFLNVIKDNGTFRPIIYNKMARSHCRHTKLRAVSFHEDVSFVSKTEMETRDAEFQMERSLFQAVT